MCQGRRKDPVISISIKDYFLEKAPPRTSFSFIMGFITISIILLGISLIPEVVMFETEFTNSDVTIMDSTGVTQILASFAASAFSSTTTNFVSSKFFLVHLVGYLVRTRILEYLLILNQQYTGKHATTMGLPVVVKSALGPTGLVRIDLLPNIVQLWGFKLTFHFYKGNPYNFTIETENSQVTVQGWWLHVLFLQFVG